MPPPITRIPLTPGKVGSACRGSYRRLSEYAGRFFDTMSESRRHGSITLPMARPRKQLDLSAVAETLVSDRFMNLTMDRIASEMNLAKATLYRMAGSREELIAICVDA